MSLWGAAIALAATPDVVLDFAAPGGLSQTYDVAGADGWSLVGAVRFDPTDQSLSVDGVYRTRQAIEPDSHLSYRVLDEAGNILIGDGVRYGWQPDPVGGLQAPFELIIPQTSEDPLRTGWDVEFNVVKEGEYWYRDKFPEIEFASIAFRNLPPRDHFVAVATWVPRYLPAGFPARIPAWFKFGDDLAGQSAFRPSLDLITTDLRTKVRSQRIDFETETFRGWMPLGEQDEGTILVRPGLVWERVRWYEAPDWFEWETVSFVSPVHYVVAAALVGALLLAGWCWIGRCRNKVLRLLALSGLAITTLWWMGNLWISGFWPAMLTLLLAWVVGRTPGISARAFGYAFAWLFMIWIEVYWGRLEGTASIRNAALFFSAATWALLLAPLLLVKSRAWSLGISLLVTLVWWFATVVGVGYNDFFFDFPSVGDLLYAGQIGQLGDSVGTLLSDRHWLPLWVWALMAIATLVGWRFNGIPKPKTRNT